MSEDLTPSYVEQGKAFERDMTYVPDRITAGGRRPEYGPDPREAGGKLRAVFVEQVGRELVDRDDDEELRGPGRLCEGCRGEQGRGGGEHPARIGGVE